MQHICLLVAIRYFARTQDWQIFYFGASNFSNVFASDGDEDNDDDSEGPSQRERQPRTTTDDDGWTTILRR